MLTGSIFCSALSSLVLLEVMTSVMAQGTVRMCYFTNWSQYRFGNGRFLPSDIDPSLCTHILYAFAHINLGNNTLEMVESGDAAFIDQIMALKNDNPDLKVLLAVGGASLGTEAFETIAGDAQRTHAFAVNAASFLRLRGFDGMEVDWEFPTENSRAMFQEFVKKIGTEFLLDGLRSGKAKLELTVAVSGDPATVSDIYGPSETDFLNLVDYVVLMAYDLWGTWSRTLGHHSPLRLVIPGHIEQGRYSMHKLVSQWTAQGVDTEKLVLGMSTYGRTGVLSEGGLHRPGDSWARHMGEAGPLTRSIGFLGYYEVCDNLKNGWSSAYNAEGEVPYAWSEKKLQYVCYDDPRSFAEKARYVLSQQLAGVMFWALDLDDFTGSHCNAGPYPLITAVKDVLEGNAVPAQNQDKNNNNNTDNNPNDAQEPPTVQVPLRTTTTVTTKSPTRTRTTTTTTTTTSLMLTLRLPTSVTVSPGTDCPPFQCPTLFGFYTDPSDCRRFYQCTFATPSRHSCPPTLLYDSSKGMCNWPRLARCQIGC